jgi:translocation and assembly module TamB
MRLFLKILAGVAVVLLVLPVAAFGLLQTEAGKGWLADRLGATGLEGSVPFDMRIAELRQGDWLVVKNLHLAVAPADLLRLRLTIRDLSADQVDVLRLPESEGEGGSGGGIGLPVDVALQSARVRTLHLAAPVLGEPLTAAVDARGLLADERFEGHLAIDRTDGQPGRVVLDAALRDGRLKLAGVADEPSGVLVRRVAGEAAPLRIELAGDGPLTDWRGEVHGSAGTLAELRAQLRIDGDVLTAEGSLAAPAFLPPALQRLAFEGVAALDAKELRRLRVVADAATLTAHGTYGEKTRIEAELEIGDLAHLVAPLSGPAQASAVVELEGDRIAVPRFEARDGTTTIAGNGTKRGSEIAGTAQLAVADLSRYGAFAGAAQLQAKLGSLGDAIVADLEGTVTKLGAAGASIGDGRVTGRARYADGAASATLDATLSEVAGGPATARAAELRLVAEQAPTGVASLSLDGRVEGIATGTAQADALIGPALTLAARASRDGDLLRLQSARLEGAGFEATAAGTLTDTLAANFALELPRLAILGEGASGRVSVEGTATGRLDAIEVAAKIGASDVVYATRRLDRLVADVTATADRARIDAAFKAAGLEGTLGGQVAQRDEAIEVRGLRLQAAGTTLRADLTLVPGSRAATGTVSAQAADLSPWSALAGTKLAGRAALEAKLAGRDVEVKLDADRLAAADVGIAKLAATARVTDPLGTPSGQAQLTMSNARLAGGEVSTLRLKASAAKPNAVDFSGDLRGRFEQPLQLAFAGALGLGPDGEKLQMTRLDGSLADARLALLKPFTATRRGSSYALSGLDLRLGEGRLAGSASLDGSAITAAFSARRLPVGTLAKLAGQDASGELGLELSASGTLEKPVARLVIEGAGLHTRPELPPLGVVAEASWRNQRVDLRGRVDGLQGAALGFAGFAPLRLQTAPLGVTLPPNEAISLHAEGAGELASLADLLPLGEDRVSGRFHLDATVRGTIARPQASGVLSLAEGRYENLALGTVVSDIAAEMAGDNDRFVLRRFSARDGRNGELTAQGGVVLSATPGPAFDLAASLRGFRVLGRDDMTAFASGDTRITGTLLEPRVTARLRVDEAEIRVPERSVASAKKLDVIEINSRTGERPALEAATKQEPQLPAALDVIVEMPGQVFVRGRGLDSEWKGRITVRGTTADPAVVGRLEVVRGSFDVLGRRFALAEGIIGFDGGERIDPRLNIVAQTEASGVTAQAIIGGTGSEPTLRLTSSPELPQDEILARVLFNRNVGQLTAAQGLQIAQAAATLASGGPGVIDRLRGKLGLDRLDVGSGSGTETDPTVSAGKYISEGVYVGVDQSVSGESKARVEVEVAPNITVETDVGSKGGGAGIGLNWKKDY